MVRLTDDMEEIAVTTILKYKMVFTVVLAIMGPGLNLAQAENKVVVIPMAGDDTTSEVRTSISSTPYTISSSGSYYFASNLAHTDTNTVAISIDADHVTLDMMGFTLSGPGKASGGTYGILMSGRTNVTITNGTVREFGHIGIYETGAVLGGHQVINVRVINNGSSGIVLIDGRSHQVRGCIALNNGDSGILVDSSNAMITNNTAQGNGQNGISGAAGSILINNTAFRNLGDYGISGGSGSSIIKNTVYSNSKWGILASGQSHLIEGNAVSLNNFSNTVNIGGILVSSDSRVVGNTLDDNEQNGIYVAGNGNIIESNHITDSNTGINFNMGRNAYRNNTAAQNTTAYGGTNIGTTTDGGGNLSF